MKYWQPVPRWRPLPWLANPGNPAMGLCAEGEKCELTVEKEREGRGNVWRHAHIQNITHGILVHAHISKHQWLPWECRHFLLILLNYILITCIKKHWMLNPFPHTEPLRLGTQRGFYSHYLNQCFPIILYIPVSKITCTWTSLNTVWISFTQSVSGTFWFVTCEIKWKFM